MTFVIKPRSTERRVLSNVNQLHIGEPRISGCPVMGFPPPHGYPSTYGKHMASIIFAYFRIYFAFAGLTGLAPFSIYKGRETPARGHACPNHKEPFKCLYLVHHRPRLFIKSTWPFYRGWSPVISIFHANKSCLSARLFSRFRS